MTVMWFVFIAAAFINLACAWQLIKACKQLRRVIGYHLRMIRNICAMQIASELRDAESVEHFHRQYRDVALEYDLWMKDLK